MSPLRAMDAELEGSRKSEDFVTILWTTQTIEENGKLKCEEKVNAQETGKWLGEGFRLVFESRFLSVWAWKPSLTFHHPFLATYDESRAKLLRYALVVASSLPFRCYCCCPNMKIKLTLKENHCSTFKLEQAQLGLQSLFHSCQAFDFSPEIDQTKAEDHSYIISQSIKVFFFFEVSDWCKTVRLKATIL